jgi:hypothetical protein
MQTKMILLNQFDLLDWNYNDDLDLSLFIMPDESIDIVMLVYCCVGVLLCWCVVFWCIVVLVYCHVGVLSCWCIALLVYCCVGVLSCWCTVHDNTPMQQYTNTLTQVMAQF